MIDAQTVVVNVPPRISAVKFGEVLLAANSPAFSECKAMYDAATGAGIDPCFALAFFRHESQFGLLGVCHDYATKSPGNTRTSRIGVSTTVTVPGKGVYVKYATWADGMRDACFRLSDPNFVYAMRGATTIEQILPIWAPTSDNNSPQAYIFSVVDSMNQWIGSSSNMAPTYDYYQLNIIDKTGELIYQNKTGSRDGYTIKEIVLHETAGPNDVKNATGAQAQALDNATLNWFLRVNNQLSIHYFLGGENNGAPVYRCCPESIMAYHAIGDKGSLSDGSVENHISIGIERMGQPNDGPVGPNQTAALCKLVLDICRRNNLTADNIVAHADVQSDKRDGRTIIQQVKDYVNANLGVSYVTTDNHRPVIQPDTVVINQKVLGGGFKAFYDKLAGVSPNFQLLTFGLPVTNEFDCDVNGDGKNFTVQLFERSGLIYEAANSSPWDVHAMTTSQLENALAAAKAKALLN